MSSNPRPEPSGPGRVGAAARHVWRRAHPRGWTLRTRLLAIVMALLVAVSVVIAAATQAALRDYLVGQVDAQLAAAGQRAERSVGPRGEPAPPPGPAPGFLTGPGQAPGSLGARIVDGRVDRAATLNGDTVVALPAELEPVLLGLPVDDRPHTRELGELGEYRLIAAKSQDGDVLVTGLPLSGVNATLLRLAVIEALLTAAGLLAVGLVGAVILRIALRPLHRVAATASRVSELPLDRGEVALSERVPDRDTDPRTEVGQVGAALNRMLGHIGAALAARQASETRVRRFVADASHELRTPLAAIRGYAELSRRVGDGVPDDVRHAMRRVESETARMTALVEDLLLLARLDSGRPLRRDPVDLCRLAVDAVSDAHVAGPDHRWQLELPDEAVTVPGDDARLHQVLANLLANARTHTPPGSTVTVSVTPEPDAAVLSVVDDGPGIAAELLPDVFDRFARADTSRSRAAGSTGLGLAIVAAIVEAHHGEVAVTSAPGRTAFTVRLPAAQPERPPTVPAKPAPASASASRRAAARRGVGS